MLDKYIQCKVSLLCECASGSSVSGGDGNVFHRLCRGMASPQCGLEHGHADEQPNTQSHKHTTVMFLLKGHIFILDGHTFPSEGSIVSVYLSERFCVYVFLLS